MRKPWVLALFFFLSGCAYFNTFYNAEQSFRKAERIYAQQGTLTPQARQEYDRVIEKCSKILQFHPRSKYVDDALFMMAVAYSRKKEREKAKKKFEELLFYFPDAAKTFPVYLELGRLYLEEGSYDQALDALEKALQGRHRREAQFLLAKAYLEAGRNEEGLALVQEILKRDPKSPYLKEVLWLGAQAAHQVKQPDQALNFLKRYLSLYLTDDEEKEAKLLLSEVLTDMGEYQKALETLNSMDLPPADLASLRRDLLKAKAQLALGDTSSAKAILRSVVRANANSDPGLEAQYQLAFLLEMQDSIDAALDYYKRVASTYKNTPFKDRAARRVEALTQLKEIQDEESVEALYRLAELNLFELNRPRDAADLLKTIVKQYPESEYAPKALYSLIYLYLNRFDLPDSAQRYFDLLGEKYSQSLYFEEAQKNFDLPTMTPEGGGG